MDTPKNPEHKKPHWIIRQIIQAILILLLAPVKRGILESAIGQKITAKTITWIGILALASSSYLIWEHDHLWIIPIIKHHSLIQQWTLILLGLTLTGLLFLFSGRIREGIGSLIVLLVCAAIGVSASLMGMLSEPLDGLGIATALLYLGWAGTCWYLLFRIGIHSLREWLNIG